MSLATNTGAFLSELFVSVQGEGSRAGQRHLFVRFAGCNLRCRYCDTPESLVPVARCRVDWPGGSTEVLDNPIAAGQLAEILDRFCRLDPSIAMISFTGGEPLVQGDFLAELVSRYPMPRPFLLETNAVVEARAGEIARRAALISADLKLPSAEGRPHWDEHERFFACCQAREVDAKIVVGEETPIEEVEEAAARLAQWAPGATVFLQPMTDRRSGRWRISQARLLRLAAVAGRSVPVRLRPQMHRLIGVR